MTEPVRVEVGGVQATAGEIKDALVILCLAASTNVKPPLKAAGHPLAGMDYMGASTVHLAAHPALASEPGSKRHHNGHVKKVISAYLAAKVREAEALEDEA